MEPLTEKEKKMTALALFGFVMRGGPAFFIPAELLVIKLGIEKEFSWYALDWISHAKSKDKQSEDWAKGMIRE